ncbi:unnamed protein product [Pleuronectes platessa]|uniref:Uncharacterized protein n=1 Tax=Pleuronectes platessa TaxID=8262 RepID=A0A9N7VQX4_PLEPL|nr:unnamed protein product [Pleuronectes platessa]
MSGRTAQRDLFDSARQRPRARLYINWRFRAVNLGECDRGPTFRQPARMNKHPLKNPPFSTTPSFSRLAAFSLLDASTIQLHPRTINASVTPLTSTALHPSTFTK